MKAEDVRAMSEDQIEDEIVNLKKEQFNLRFQRASSQLEKPARIREVRRTIALLKTILRQKTAPQKAAASKAAPSAKKAAKA